MKTGEDLDAIAASIFREAEGREAQQFVAACPVYWFMLLDRFVNQGNMDGAAIAQDMLRDLGVVVRYTDFDIPSRKPPDDRIMACQRR